MLKKVPLNNLSSLLPKNAFEFVLPYLNNYRIILKIVSKRKTILGTYLFHPQKKRHEITLNEDLNPYSMLLTLIHEIAHLLIRIHYSVTVKPHGLEWKRKFKQLLEEAISLKLFPNDLTSVLIQSVKKYQLSCTTNDRLFNALRKYDPVQIRKNFLQIKDLEIKENFQLSDGRVFVNFGKKIKRFYGQEVCTKRWYSFHPYIEVKRVE